MPDIDQYAPGTPSWVDVSAPDTDAAAAFYSGLFGWTAGAAGPLETTGGYRMMSMRGRAVAGMGPTREGGPPPLWSTYVTVADADAGAAAITAAGGTVILEPMDVLQAGRMAVALDPQGAMFRIWEARESPGCQIVGEPGAFAWSELATTDREAAAAFYGAVFGWTTEAAPDAGGIDYTMIELDGRGIAGMLDLEGTYPQGVPPSWLVYFAVADCAATVARASELGGAVRMGPTTIPAGTFAVLADPADATFAVIEPSPEMAAASGS
jgi:predicted enzyme related to lactoylglutathione lyase